MAEKDFKDLNQQALDTPADSARDIIEDATPPAEKEFHNPGDVGPTEHGAGTEGPANYYSEKAEAEGAAGDEPPKPGGKDGEKPGEGAAKATEAPAGRPEATMKDALSVFAKTGFWINFLKPVVVLVLICVVVSTLLAFTNDVTAPIIQANNAASAEATRKALLPAADGFTDVTPATVPNGVTAMYQANNGVGYVVEASATGYGGQVPAVVAFDANGSIAGVEFPANDETPGLGAKVSTDVGFANQFAGRDAAYIDGNGIDKIASATISSNAALTAVNAAIELYGTEVGGGAAAELTPEEQRAVLLPGAEEIREISVEAEGVTEAWAGDDGSFIIYAEAPGIYAKPVTAVVALDAEGAILGLALNTEGETAGYGKELDRNAAFIESFTGLTDPWAADTVAGATVSSDAVKQAVEYALNALGAAKEAA